jgi:phospholipase/lecithinase/hemolysin
MKRWLLALTLIACGAPALAKDHHKQHIQKTIYVFGDSYSDNGNALVMYPDILAGILQPPYASPRFSNGPMWPDYMGQALDEVIGPQVAGGTNYAVGGATISPENHYSFDPGADGFAQVDRFLADHGSADPAAIYVVWLGGNDIDPPESFTRWCFDQLVVMIGRLYQAGARTFLVPNLNDFGDAPLSVPYAEWFGADYVQQLSEMVTVYNSLLEELPARFPAARFRIADVYHLYKMVKQYPKSFGFSVVDEACYHDWTDGALCSDPDEYWYWGFSHPTTHAHKVLSSFFVMEMLIAGELKFTDLVH